MMTSYGHGSSIATAPIETYSAVTPAFLPLTSSMNRNGEDDVLARERPEPPRVVFVHDEIEWIARVHIVVGVTAGEPLDVVEAAQADDPVHELRMTQA